MNKMPTPRPFADVARDVAAARASLPAPLPDEEWLKEAARRAIERLYANTNYSREGNPIDQQDCLNDDAIVGLQAAMVRLAQLRARHGADHASPRSDGKETFRLAALEEAARAVELIEAQCEAEDVDSPELPVVAAAIRALKGAK